MELPILKTPGFLAILLLTSTLVEPGNAAALPSPVVTVSPVTETGAKATWTWSGSTANATGIRVSVVKTTGFDGPTEVAILSDYPISKTSTSLQLEGIYNGTTNIYFIPGAYYRVNIRYVAASGYTDGSTAKPFTMLSLSAPTGLSQAPASTSVGLDWGNVNGASGYRLMVRKTGASWPADTSSATSSAPVNYLVEGSAVSQFTWTTPSGSQVYASPIPGQSYEWRVKAYYTSPDGGTTVSSSYSSAGSFTVPANTPLPAPVVTVSPVTETGARATWTWSGSTANSTGILIGISKTTGYDGPAETEILADYYLADTSTSLQMDGIFNGTTNIYFIPGAHYRVNVRYLAASGYTEGSMAKPFTMLSLSAPSGISQSASTSSVDFDWGNVSGASGYRFMVRKSGYGWPVDETSAATSGVPINYLIGSAADSQFAWSSPGGSQVYQSPVPGQSYEWRVKAYYTSPGGGTTVSSGYSTTGSFTVPSAPANPLGIDLTYLNGKNVRGPLVFGATNATAITLLPWKRFYLRSGNGAGPVIAQCYVGGGTDSVLSEVAWRKPDGTYISEWLDLISTTTILVLEGEDSVGQPVQSAPFTVTPQTSLTVTVPDPAGASFPTVVPGNSTTFNPTFSASVSGNSGTASYAWFYRSTAAATTASSYSPTFVGSGVHMVTVRVSDTNNNVTWAQYIAPVAKRLDYGNPAISRSGSVLTGPVDVVSGNLHLFSEDLSVDCYGVPFALTRSLNSRPGATSAQWLFNIEEYALTDYTRTNQSDFNGRGLRIIRSDGSMLEYFLDAAGNYRPLNPGNFDLAVETGIDSTRELTVYEAGGVVRSYVKSTIPVSSNSYSGTFWTLKSVKTPRGHGFTINHSSTASRLVLLPRITSITDAANRSYPVSYDSSGRISQVSDFTGRYVSYTWDSNNNITSFRDVRGYTTHYSYRTSSPGDMRLLSVQTPRGNYAIQAIAYDGSDRVTGLQDGDGYTTSYSYAAASTTVTPPITQERVRYTIDPTSKAITDVTESYGYGDYTTSMNVRSTASADAIANYSLIDSRTDPASRTTRLGYANNTRGQVRTITGNDNVSATISYNNLDLSRNLYTPSSVTSRAGRVYDMTPNSYGEITSSEDAANNATTTTYNSYGLPATITDALGRTTTISYNTSGYPTQITDALNQSVVITNDSLGRPTRIVDRRGSKTDFTYDNDGNVLTVSDHLNNQIVNSYDENGNLTSTRDRRGNFTTSTYNNRDLAYQISRTAPVNGTNATITETNTYDGMGRVTQTTNGRGNSTQQTYTNRGQLSSVINGAGETTLSVTYNLDGTVATRTTGSGATASTITYGYDSLGRQTSATDNLGNQVQTSYNADHQVTGTRDARGAWTYLGYDAAARLSSVTDANGSITRADYDAAGNLTQVQDPRGNSTYHTYDALNRRTQEKDHLNRIWGFSYDAEGNLLTESFPDGRSFSYTFDSLGRLDYLDYGGSRYADPSYDADGNMTSLGDHLGTTSFSWDSLNRLTSVTDPFGQTLSYLYDAASNRTRINYPGSRIVNYTYDGAERMSTVAPWAGGTFTYAWRADNKLARITNGNSTYTTFGYDAAARLTSMITRASGGTAFITQNFTLDANGNITRLSGDQPTAPPADPAKSMTVDATNRLLTNGSTSVNHDAAGRMTANPATPGGASSFEGRDWLASYTSTGGSATTYSYNGLGQRLSRNQNGTTTRYLLDPNQDLPAVLAENNSSNSPQRFYIHGLGLLASIDTSNNVQIYHPNHRGDILALTNSSGTVTESYGYSPYGLTSASNPSSTNPFRFGGALGVLEEGNGLHFMRARYYNPSIGRFLSIDQLPGSLGNPQTLDRLAYGLGNPLSNVDPSGLAYLDTEISGLHRLLAEQDEKIANVNRALAAKNSKDRISRLSKIKRRHLLERRKTLEKIKETEDLQLAFESDQAQEFDVMNLYVGPNAYVYAAGKAVIKAAGEYFNGKNTTKSMETLIQSAVCDVAPDSFGKVSNVISPVCNDIFNNPANYHNTGPLGSFSESWLRPASIPTNPFLKF